MTNKTAEDEAREWASNWAWDGVMYWKLPDSEEELLGMQFAIKAHLAGQSVGYQRALGEVVKIMNERWGTISDTRLIELEEVINNLKAKGGA